MNDLPLHVDPSTDMYADDSTLCETGKTVEELNVKFNEDMVSVKKWCYNNQMAANGDSEKLLGVRIDKHLTWKEHVNQTAKKISGSIALLRRISAYLLHQTRITFYKTYIQTHIDYCNTVWGQSTCVPRIHILQKYGPQNNHGCPKPDPPSPPF